MGVLPEQTRKRNNKKVS